MKKIEYHGAIFYVNEFRILMHLTAPNDASYVYVPKVFPDGTEIDVIGNRCFTEEFGTVEITPDIRGFDKNAFSGARIDTLIWPDSCGIITRDCFKHSNIKEIRGIDNVERVEKGAFSNSTIQTLKWPSKCSVIPNECFKESKIECITNIDHVNKIGTKAFCLSNVKEIRWPDKCNKIPPSCFLGCHFEKIYNLEHVTEISQYAFFNAVGAQNLDLSQAVCTIDKDAFRGMGEGKVILPYYNIVS